MSKQPPPAPTASAIGPCPTIIQSVGRSGTGSLPRTIAPPNHPVDVEGGGWVVLNRLPVPRRPIIWMIVGQGPIALAVGAGGVVWTFLLCFILSRIFSLSLGTGGARVERWLVGWLFWA